MKFFRRPLTLLVVLCAVLAGLLFTQGMLLPERVATRFDGSGRASGWMPLPYHLTLSAALCLLLPAIPVFLFSMTPRLHKSLVNLPNKKYWLSEERRKATTRWLVRHSLWLSCLILGLVIAIQALIFAANLQDPPRLPGSIALLLVGAFLAGLAIWTLILWRRFASLPVT